MQRCRPAFAKFKKDILSTRPHFSPREKKFAALQANHEVIAHEEDVELGVVSIRDVIYVDEVAELVES